MSRYNGHCDACESEWVTESWEASECPFCKEDRVIAALAKVNARLEVAVDALEFTKSIDVTGADPMAIVAMFYTAQWKTTEALAKLKEME
jgi:hypothetical protein